MRVFKCCSLCVCVCAAEDSRRQYSTGDQVVVIKVYRIALSEKSGVLLAPHGRSAVSPCLKALGAGRWGGWWLGVELISQGFGCVVRSETQFRGKINDVAILARLIAQTRMTIELLYMVCSGVFDETEKLCENATVKIGSFIFCVFFSPSLSSFAPLMASRIN